MDEIMSMMRNVNNVNKKQKQKKKILVSEIKYVKKRGGGRMPSLSALCHLYTNRCFFSNGFNTCEKSAHYDVTENKLLLFINIHICVTRMCETKRMIKKQNYAN